MGGGGQGKQEGENNVTTLDPAAHQFRSFPAFCVHEQAASFPFLLCLPIIFFNFQYHLVTFFFAPWYLVSQVSFSSPLLLLAVEREFFFFSLSFSPTDLYLFLANSLLYDKRQHGHTQMQFIFAHSWSACVCVCVSVRLSHCLTSFNSTQIFLITVWNSPEFPCCESWKSWHQVATAQLCKGNSTSLLVEHMKGSEW